MNDPSQIYLFSVFLESDKQLLAMLWYEDDRWIRRHTNTEGHVISSGGTPDYAPHDYYEAEWERIDLFSPLHWLECAECSGVSFLDYLCPECRS